MIGFFGRLRVCNERKVVAWMGTTNGYWSSNIDATSISKQYFHFQIKHHSLPSPFIISFEMLFTIIEQGIKMNLGRWWVCKEQKLV